MPTARKKFMVDPSGCHLWVGAMTEGHPIMKCGRTNVMARRYFYELKHGPIPGRRLDLLCGRGNCVNPDHCAPHVNKSPKVVRKSHEVRREEREEIRMLRGCEKIAVVAAMYNRHPCEVSRIQARRI